MNRYFLLLLIFIAAFACDEKEEEIVPQNTNSVSQPEPEPVVEEVPPPPAFNAGFPKARQGATSADLEFQTDKACTVYYVVSEQTMKLTALQLIQEAKSPTLPEIKINGMTTVNPNENSVQPLKNLNEGRNYFGYMVPATEADHPDSLKITEFQFTTEIRQDTLQFHSASEQRNVDYLIYKPEEVFKSPEGKYPIIIFLGGLGERAHGNKRINVIQNGLLPEYIFKGNDVPMMVMSVQHATPKWKTELIKEAFDFAMENLPVDKNKVYLVGTSAGAFGAWKFAEEYPERITAIVPISGGGEKDKVCAMKELAVWAFHNKQDHLVPASESKHMIDALNKCAPTHEALLHIFPDAGHDVWRRIFDDKHPDWAKSPNEPRVNIYDWLLKQSRLTAN